MSAEELISEKLCYPFGLDIDYTRFIHCVSNKQVVFNQIISNSSTNAR